ncbi:MAG: hypothetical protein LBQ47_00595, partial [Endomicrobium sp.]|nr:hypothetical protein [Endomicrobium sp.]
EVIDDNIILNGSAEIDGGLKNKLQATRIEIGDEIEDIKVPFEKTESAKLELPKNAKIADEFYNLENASKRSAGNTANRAGIADSSQNSTEVNNIKSESFNEFNFEAFKSYLEKENSDIYEMIFRTTNPEKRKYSDEKLEESFRKYEDIYRNLFKQKSMTAMAFFIDDYFVEMMPIIKEAVDGKNLEEIDWGNIISTGYSFYWSKKYFQQLDIYNKYRDVLIKLYATGVKNTFMVFEAVNSFEDCKKLFDSLKEMLNDGVPFDDDVNLISLYKHGFYAQKPSKNTNKKTGVKRNDTDNTSGRALTPVNNTLSQIVEKVNAANPAATVKEAQKIAVKLVIGNEQIEEIKQLKNEDLKISQNLVIVDALEQAQQLQKQGFNAAVTSVAQDKPTAAEGWKKVKFAIQAKDAKISVYVRNEDGVKHISFYSKKGEISLQTAQAEFENIISEGVKDNNFKGIKQIVITNANTAGKVIEIMKNSHTDAVNTPTKEMVLNLYEKEETLNRASQESFENLCKNEYEANDIGIFVVSKEQAQVYRAAINRLRRGYGIKFIVNTNVKDYKDIQFDGSRIEAQEITAIDEAVKLLEDLSVNKHQKFAFEEIDARISARFNDDILNEFKARAIDVWKKYGIIPIAAGNSIYRQFAKTEIQFDNRATIDEINRFLADDNAISLSLSDAAVLNGNLKEEIKTAKTAKQKYNKGYNASLDSKFDYTARSAELFSLISKPVEEVGAQEIKDIIEKKDNGLSADSQSYIEHLLSKERYEEAAGFIRGAAMNAAQQQIIDALAEKGIEIKIDDFKKYTGGKYRKALLTLALQLQISGKTIKDLLNDDYTESGNMSAEQFFNSLTVEIGKNIDDILRDNEYEIKAIKEQEEEKSVEMFKKFNVLLQDKFRQVKLNAKVLVSVNAVRNILSAA